MCPDACAGTGDTGWTGYPLALSGPQFPCLRSSMLGSWAALPGPGSLDGWVWGGQPGSLQEPWPGQGGEEGQAGQTFLGTHWLRVHSQGGILVVTMPPPWSEGHPLWRGAFQTTSVALMLGLRHGAGQGVRFRHQTPDAPNPCPTTDARPAHQQVSPNSRHRGFALARAGHENQGPCSASVSSLPFSA